MRKILLLIFLYACPAQAVFAGAVVNAVTPVTAAGAALTASNISLAELSLVESISDGAKSARFKVVVYNAGGSAESNIGVKLSFGGIDAQDSPRRIQTLAAGDRKELVFTAPLPSDSGSVLAVACVDTFDDNLADNCKTKSIAMEPGGYSKKVDYDELRAELQKRLTPDAFKELEGYTFESLECGDCSGSELDDILAAFINGEAALKGASISEIDQAPAPAAVNRGGKARRRPVSVLEESSVLDLELVPSPRESLAADYYLVKLHKGSDSNAAEYILKVVGKKTEKTQKIR